jgi:putative ABC transport system permease protein
VIRHLLKLVWHRKRANALLIVEIFFSFLVVLAVATVSLYFLDLYRQPLGYDWRDVWSVAIDTGQEGGDYGMGGAMETYGRLLREIGSLGPVVATAGTSIPPFAFGTDTTSVRAGEGTGKAVVEAHFNRVTDDLPEALGVEVVSGRWFGAADSALDWRPVVIDRDLARDLFGDQDPVGRSLAGIHPAEVEHRVVGVVADYRKDGELAARSPYLFRRIDLDDPGALPARYLVVRVRPGTPAGFEEELVERLRAVAPDWSFEPRALANARATGLRLRLMPLVAGGLVAGFLLLMVALGLVGVLWQNVVERTRELGLRRAAGAARRDIHRQISMELLILTTLGLALGTLLAVQLPILDLAPFLGTGTFTAALALSAGLLSALALAAAAYPAWLASRVQPAEALRWE